MTLYVTPDLDTHRARFWHTDLIVLVRANPEAFRQLVTRQRQTLGFGLLDVASRCTLSHQTVSDVEWGRYPGITSRTIREVMDALGLTVDDLRAEIAAMNDMREAA